MIPWIIFNFRLPGWLQAVCIIGSIIAWFLWEMSLWDGNKARFTKDFMVALASHGVESVYKDTEMWNKVYVSVNKGYQSIAVYHNKHFAVYGPGEIISCEVHLSDRSQYRAGSAIVTIEVTGTVFNVLLLEFIEHEPASKLCQLVHKVMNNKPKEG